MFENESPSHSQRYYNDFRCKNLVGHAHPNIWKLIEILQKDEAESSAMIRSHRDFGNAPRKRVRRETKALNERLKNLCIEFRDGVRDLPLFLRAIGNNIRFGVNRINGKYPINCRILT